jgi:hypothetical protein
VSQSPYEKTPPFKQNGGAGNAFSMWDPAPQGDEPATARQAQGGGSVEGGRTRRTGMKAQADLDDGGKMQADEQHHDKRRTPKSILQQRCIGLLQYPAKCM